MDRIYSNLALAGECWEWQGNRGHVGHGMAYYAGRMHLVHRLVWTDLRGEIPDGLELDHLCRNPPCCNPDHLDPVTHAENMRRGIQSFDVRTHCLSGRHRLTPEVIYTRPADGRQQCRLCRSENRRRRRALGLPT